MQEVRLALESSRNQSAEDLINTLQSETPKMVFTTNHDRLKHCSDKQEQAWLRRCRMAKTYWKAKLMIFFAFVKNLMTVG